MNIIRSSLTAAPNTTEIQPGKGVEMMPKSEIKRTL
jgi:hypothetical protein